MPDPTPAQDVDHPIRRSISDALATGFRTYGPSAVGLWLVGVPVCGLAAFAHFVLGIGLEPDQLTRILGAVGIGGAGVYSVARRDRSPEE